MRGKWVLLAGVVVLVAIAAGALTVWRRELAAKRKPVVTNAAIPLPPGTEINLPGRVEAKNVVPVAATIEGTIDAFHVQVGDEVFEGQLLASIKNTDLESARDVAAMEFERAETRITNLELQHQRPHRSSTQRAPSPVRPVQQAVPRQGAVVFFPGPNDFPIDGTDSIAGISRKFHSFALDDTFVLSPTLTGSVRYGFSRRCV